MIRFSSALCVRARVKGAAMSFFTDREGGAREPLAPVLSIAALAELGVTHHTDKRKKKQEEKNRPGRTLFPSNSFCDGPGKRKASDPEGEAAEIHFQPSWHETRPTEIPSVNGRHVLPDVWTLGRAKSVVYVHWQL